MTLGIISQVDELLILSLRVKDLPILIFFIVYCFSAFP